MLPTPETSPNRRPRIVALVSIFNELRYLPGWFDNIRGRISAVAAIDDGSADASADYVAAQPETTLLLRTPAASKGEWDETINRRTLVTAGQGLGADWFLTTDCDDAWTTFFGASWTLS